MRQIGTTKISRLILSSLLTLISLTLGQVALAEDQEPYPDDFVNHNQKTEAGAPLICEDCVSKDAAKALGQEIVKHISKTFGKEIGKVTTRPVDVSQANQAFLNAVGSIIVPVIDENGEVGRSLGAGTLTTELSEKPCVILTAKHVACGSYIKKDKNGERNVYPMKDAECTDPTHTVEVNIGKTKDPKGDGFDFKVDAQVVDVGSFNAPGDRGDWAVLKIIGKAPRRADFPKPIRTAFAEDPYDYTGLKVVSAGYPGYGKATKLYADWKCRSYPAGFGIAKTNCEIDNGFSGGPLLGNVDGIGLVQLGINSSGASEIRGKRRVQTDGKVVSFELSNAEGHKVTEGAKIREAMLSITCD